MNHNAKEVLKLQMANRRKPTVSIHHIFGVVVLPALFRCVPPRVRLNPPRRTQPMASITTFDDLVPQMKRAGLFATSLAAVITAKFGWALGEDILAKISLSGLLALCTFIVGYSLVAAWHAYQRGMPAVAGAATALFAVAIVVEFLSHTGFTAANRDATLQQASLSTTAYEDTRGNVTLWQDAVKRAQEDRSKMQPVRAAAAARAAIDTAQAHKFWRTTDGCKETKGPQSRKFCEDYNAAQADIALWDAISVQEGKIADASAKLEEAKAKSASSNVAHASGASQSVILASLATAEQAPSSGAQYWAGVGISALLAVFAICAGGLLNFIAFAFDGPAAMTNQAIASLREAHATMQEAAEPSIVHHHTTVVAPKENRVSLLELAARNGIRIAS